jgi:hypothetical protein
MAASDKGQGPRLLRRGRAPAGVVLAEFLLALSVVSVLISIAATNYETLRRYIFSEDQASRLVQLVADVHQLWDNAPDYSTVSPLALSQLNLIRKPLTFDGTSMQDQWGNPMQVMGGGRTFAISIGGAFNPMRPDECAAIGNRLAPIAQNINVGQAATLATGFSTGKVTGGLPFKASANLNQDSLIIGCSQASAVVAAEFN